MSAPASEKIQSATTVSNGHSNGAGSKPAVPKPMSAKSDDSDDLNDYFVSGSSSSLGANC